MTTIEREIKSEILNPYLNYPGRPIYLGPVASLKESGQLSFEDKRVTNFHFSHFWPLVMETMEGLLEDLAPRFELTSGFRKEYDRFTDAYVEDPQCPAYGEAFFYPSEGNLVLYAPKYWHLVALHARNSLVSSENDIVVAVAGASVGQSVLKQIVKALPYRWAKTADPRVYKTTNTNRVELSYKEIGQAKTTVTAAQIHNFNPYLPISVYPDGVANGQQLHDFIAGNSRIGEPAASIVWDETDDPYAKYLLRTTARVAHIPVGMVTDLWDAYQADFQDYQRNPQATIAIGIPDDVVDQAYQASVQNPMDRNAFFHFAKLMAGPNWQRSTLFKAWMDREIAIPFKGIPQWGATATAAAGKAAINTARWALGETIPEREFVQL